MREPSELSKTDCISTTSANDLFHFTVYDINMDGNQAKSPSIVLDSDIIIGVPETPSSSELSYNCVQHVAGLHFQLSVNTIYKQSKLIMHPSEYVITFVIV